MTFCLHKFRVHGLSGYAAVISDLSGTLSEVPKKRFCMMFKFFLTILFVFSACAVVAHSVLAYGFNSVETLLDEKETSEGKPMKKDTKDYGQEKLISFSHFFQLFSSGNVHHTALHNLLKCPNGFYNPLYDPPEII